MMFWVAMLATALVLHSSPTATHNISDQPCTPEPSGYRVPDEYLVVLSDGIAAADRNETIAALTLDYGLSVQFVFPSATDFVIRTTSPDVLAALRADPRVAGVGETHGFALDDIPSTVRRATPEGHALRILSVIQQQACNTQESSTGLRRVGPVRDICHHALANDGSQVNIAIIDTGITSPHEDLTTSDGHIQSGLDCTGTGDPLVDPYAHSTQVAGIIGALDNTNGALGVAMGATLYSVKAAALNPTTGKVSATFPALACAVQWARTNGTNIDIINLSLAVSLLYDFSPPLRPLVQLDPNTCDIPDTAYDEYRFHREVCLAIRSGIIVVSGAGNAGIDVTQGWVVPAGYSEAITVGAYSDSDGRPGAAAGPVSCPDTSPSGDDIMWGSSNTGSKVDILAPGVCVKTTNNSQNGYIQATGASMAAPFVTGAVALFLQAHRGELPEGAARTDAVRRHLVCDQEGLPGAGPGTRPDICTQYPALDGQRRLGLLNLPSMSAWGNNSFGQLGTEGANNTIAQRVKNVGGAVAVAAGPDYTLAVKADGTVWAWGDNSSGQLGIGSSPGNVSVPTQVQFPSGVHITTVAAGVCHSLAIDTNRQAWSWGCNDSGQLGNYTRTDSPSPVPVGGLSGVTSIAAGSFHSLAVANGQVYAWGNGGGGALGYEGSPVGGRPADQLVPVPSRDMDNAKAVAAGYGTSLALKTDGSVWYWGMPIGDYPAEHASKIERQFPARLEAMSPVIAIAMDQRGHALAVKAASPTAEFGDEVWVWNQINDGLGGPPPGVEALEDRCAAEARDSRVFPYLSGCRV